MNRVLVVAGLTLSVAVRAAGETCTVQTGTSLWLDVTKSNISSTCTEDPTDDFVIPSGATVRIAGHITLTTGSITINSGGKLIQPSGWTLSPGAYLHVNPGGSYEATGSVLAHCIVTEEPDWAPANQVSIKLDCPTTSLITEDSVSGTQSPDMIYFEDEDPPPGTDVNGQVWDLPGRPRSTIYRPAYNKWAMYQIHSTSAGGLTYTVNPWRSGRTGTPYAGNLDKGWGRAAIPRLNGSCASTLAGAGVCYRLTRQRFGFATRVDIAHTQASSGDAEGIAITNADLGSQYLYYPEKPTTNNPADPRSCAGKSAKILTSVDGGAGEDDTIYVAGDLSACDNGKFQITMGARRGDRVTIFRPAVLDGRVSGVNKSSLSASGGTIEITWARLIGMSFMDGRNGRPRGTGTQAGTVRPCIICFYRDSAADQPSGSITFTDIAGFSGATIDTGIIHLDSVDGSFAFRYGTYLDASKLVFDHLYIHDAMRDSADDKAGDHGFLNDSAYGARLTRTRIERLTDAEIGSDDVNFGTTRMGEDIEDVLLFENIAGTPNSQKCMNPTSLVAGSGENNVQWLNSGWLNAVDVVAIGCADNSVSVIGLGARLKRIVAGGSKNITSNSSIFEVDVASGAPTASQETYPNIVQDSLIALYGVAANASSSAFNGAGRLESSVVWGNEATAKTTLVASFWGTYDKVFLDMPGSSENSECLFSFQNNSASTDVLAITNSAILCPSNYVFAKDYGVIANAILHDSLVKLELKNVFLQFVNPGGGNIFAFVGQSTNFANRNLGNIDGLVVGENVTAGNSANDVNHGSDITNAIFQGSLSRMGTWGMNVTPSSYVIGAPPLGSSVNGDSTLRSFLGSADAPDAIHWALPRELGIQSVGPATLALGSFVTEQMRNFSDKDLLVDLPEPQCDDGIDNDGDGLIDFPSDPDCEGPDDLSERPACSDGFDNDGDGRADYPADPGCANSSSTTESPGCQDGIDNDGDGGIDFDGGALANHGVALGPQDVDCIGNPSRNEEGLGNCGLGGELGMGVLGLMWLCGRRRRIRV